MKYKQSALKPKVLQGDLDEEYLTQFGADDRIAVDCEMMGLHFKRDRLCIVQLCSPSNKAALVQVLPGQKSAPNLQKIMENEEIVKVFHFARMDTLFIRHWLQIRVKNIFCTKIASKLARTYTDKHGLKDLVREFFEIHMDKKNQSSDWGKKNLSNDQIEYAAEDVRYLLSLEQILTGILYREGRLELAQECFRSIPMFNNLDLFEIQELFEH